MRQFIFLSITLSFLLARTVDGKCDHVELVKCFINVLDDFTHILWNTRSNVVTVTEKDCAIVRKMGECIDDTANSQSKPHGCTRQDVIETSKTLSDLLMHREKAGTFVKSYFLMKYVCTPEGQTLVSKHRQCLANENIGKATLSAASYLTAKYIETTTTPAEACTMLNQRLNEYKTALKNLCSGDASLLMCESIVRAVQGVYPDKVGQCENISCRLQPTAAPTLGESQPRNGKPTGDGGGAAQTTASIVTLALPILLAGMLR